MASGPATIPFLRYADARAAIDFLTSAFGFEEKLVVPGEGSDVAHAELTFGNGMVLYERAKGAGATIQMELTDQEYGSREFIALDPEGNIWSFGTYDPFAPQG
jgi:uncharacterized glyoxalase superfamily protein PhnB